MPADASQLCRDVRVPEPAATDGSSPVGAGCCNHPAGARADAAPGPAGDADHGTDGASTASRSAATTAPTSAASTTVTGPGRSGRSGVALPGGLSRTSRPASEVLARCSSRPRSKTVATATLTPGGGTGPGASSTSGPRPATTEDAGAGRPGLNQIAVMPSTVGPEPVSRLTRN